MSRAVVAQRETISSPFVAHDAGKLGAALVVQPSFALESAAPVQGESSPIAERAIEQHGLLVARLRASGASVVVLDADPELPLGFAVADIAVAFASGAVLMRPTNPGRRREVARVESALRGAGVPIVGSIEPPGLLDGGDVVVAGDVVYLAVPKDRASAVGVARSVRGNEAGRAQLAAIARDMGLRVTSVTIGGDVRGLRSVATFVDRTTIVIAPGVVDASAFGDVSHIDVPRGEDYGAGVVTLAPRRVLANLRFRTVLPILRRAKVGVEAIDLWEFGKLGVTPSTMVLALKRV